jgi:uncharacterized membrane protein
MPEAQRRFSMSRLEAFSDGVIAVIITIMVLELKAPETPQPAALLRLWPSFAIYLVSFVLVAIYWVNHHNLLASAGGVTARLIWANNALLFCLSLIPFATAYVADTQLAPFPTMVYGALQFACGLAYFLVLSTISAARQRAAAEPFEGSRLHIVQNTLALVIYALGTAIALLSPLAALGLFVFVAIAYVVPGLLAEVSHRRHTH